MNTKRKWTQVTVVVVLALASLSSVAMSAPHRDRLTILAADLCGATAASQLAQYAAAIEWAEQGGTEVPLALTVSCVENNPDHTASQADLGGDSWVRFEQYMSAIEGTELTLNTAPFRAVQGGPNAFDQYLAAIEWAERGGKVPQALSVSGGKASADLTASTTGGGDSWLAFEQYMAAVEGRELALDDAPVRTVSGGGARIEQYASAVDSNGRVWTFAPESPTGEHDLQLFAQYLAAIANAGRGPMFASEADWEGPN